MKLSAFSRYLRVRIITILTLLGMTVSAHAQTSAVHGHVVTAQPATGLFAAIIMTGLFGLTLLHKQVSR